MTEQQTIAQLVQSIGNVVQYGSNTNGAYLKFGNGVMIAWNTFTHSTLGSTSNNNIGTYGWSFYYGNDAVTFPIAFIAAPTIVASCYAGVANVYNPTASGFDASIYGHSTIAREYNWLAIGRWK